MFCVGSLKSFFPSVFLIIITNFCSNSILAHRECCVKFLMEQGDFKSTAISIVSQPPSTALGKESRSFLFVQPSVLSACLLAIVPLDFDIRRNLCLFSPFFSKSNNFNFATSSEIVLLAA